jgi:tRNA G18 (ribose-2'-O)-methylase SpoU
VPVVRIEDPKDARLDGFSHDGEAAGTLVAESALAVDRLLASTYEVIAVLATSSHAERLGPRVRGTVPLYVAAPEIVAHRVGRRFHRGCAAIARRPAPAAPEARAQLLPPRVLALDRVTDPVNVGAVIRHAAALGAPHVVLGPGCGDPWSRRAIRASVGNVFRLCVEQVPDLHAWVDSARRSSPETRVLAAVLDADAAPLGTFRAPERAILLLGNEGDGLGPVSAAADLRVTIPMDPTADSLNVAAAAAVLLFALHPPLTLTPGLG